MNASFNSAINTSPSRIIFGDMVSLNRGLLTSWDSNKTDPVLATEYMQQLNEQLSTIISISSAFQESLHKDIPIVESGPIKEFAVSDFVLVSYPVRRASKLGPLLRGPYCVIAVPSTNTYVCQDLLTHNSITVDVSRLTRWVDSPAEQDPGWARREANLRDNEEYVVDSIISHTGNPKRKGAMMFKVRWQGLGSEWDSDLPFKEVNKLAAFDTYLAENPSLNLH